jgi:hypothetical protein
MTEARASEKASNRRARTTSCPFSHSLEALPFYASDEAIGAAILGKARAKEWCAIALVLERKGLPPVDALHKGRRISRRPRGPDIMEPVEAPGSKNMIR